MIAMARRRKTNPLEGVFVIASTLPWWAGVTLAGLAYVVLHWVAVAEVSSNAGLDEMGQFVWQHMAKALATFCQYLIPLALLAGTVASYFGRRKRAQLIDDVIETRPAQALRNMNWLDFELLVGEIFRMRGFAVTERRAAGADGGIDLELRKGGETFLVQCKQWRAYKVSVMVVRELYGVMAAKGAAGGFVVTSGVFTRDAQKFAKGQNIELIDGAALAILIQKVSAARKTIASPNDAMLDIKASLTTSATATVVDRSCPRCGNAMVKRVAKRGPNVGGAFWGCSTFPRCRGVRGAPD
jgi:restriction system protein